MLLAPEVVGDIPVFSSGLVGRAGATLNVPRLRLPLLSTGVAPDVGAHRGPGDSATDGGNVIAASVTDLVAENAANEGAGNRPGNVSAASLLRDGFVLYPASLLGRCNHRVD